MTTDTHVPADTASFRNDPLAFIAAKLVEKVPALRPDMQDDITDALHELLDGRDELAIASRTKMQHHLTQVAEGHSVKLDACTGDDEMLTTEQAADLMHCPPPYVAMLIDNKKLIGATVEKGVRHVPASSIHAWIKIRAEKSKESDYRAAATDAGMYDIPEQIYVEAAADVQKSPGA